MSETALTFAFTPEQLAELKAGRAIVWENPPFLPAESPNQRISLRLQPVIHTVKGAPFRQLRRGDEWEDYEYRGYQFGYVGVGNAGYYSGAGHYLGRDEATAREYLDKQADAAGVP